MPAMSIHDGITARLLSQHNIAVNPTWLNRILTDSNLSTKLNSTPLPELSQLVLQNLLLTDIRTSIKVPPEKQSEWLLPKDIDNKSVKQRRLKGPIFVQLLDIYQIGRSRLAQVEQLALAGSGTGGSLTGENGVVRSLPRDESGELVRPVTRNPPSSTSNEKSSGNGPHRFIFQDAAGTLITALDLRSIPSLHIDHPVLFIGSKFILSNLDVARGMALLENHQVSALGGKLENRDKTWRAERKERLMAKLNAD